MNRRSFCSNLAALPAALPRLWDPAAQLRFVLQDHLDHPFYWWPATLLSYPLQFRKPVDLSRLLLTRADTGQPVPIQFSDIVQNRDGARSATLHFLSDLPTGARREFVLSASSSPIVHTPQVRETREGDTLVLDSGPLRVRIPASQQVRGDAPGPILQLARPQTWVGSSTLTLSDGPITRITTRRLAAGPLFLAYEIAYENAAGSRYVARLQLNAGHDLVSLREDMEALRAGVTGLFTSTWSGFDVTHRQAPNHPVPVVPDFGPYDGYPWERIDEPWRGRDIIMGSSRPVYFESPPAGELPFSLGIFQSWPAYHVLDHANFWAHSSGDALGVFIDDAAAWQDHEYAYEVQSTALQVRFHYQDRRFSWRWPLTRGRRSTCVAFYPHDLDKQAMRDFERAARGVEHKGLTYQVGRAYTSHTLFLHNRYGILHLDTVKDWVLEYPSYGHHPPVLLSDGMIHQPGELERRVMASGYLSTLPIFGARENGGGGPVPGRNIVNFSPVPSRQLTANWVGGFNSSFAAMDERQRRRLTAAFLFLAYVHMGDNYMPLVPMLGGHPNFLADVKGGMAAASFLFPDHPMAPVWADQWEKCVELNTRFNTRPAVRAWDAQAGRWTENLGTYVWAFLHPSLRTAFLLRQYDGVERFLSPQLADVARWLVNALSAPFHGETEEGFRVLQQFDNGRQWCVLAPGQGPRRVHPPQGAHSERRIPPASLFLLGHALRQYAPLAAEYAMWASRPTDQDAETPLDAPKTWQRMYELSPNPGTNPRLRSAKFTGYGIVLRAAVDTPNELSVHLQQIDESPNYRWGRTGEGNCGALYFFAAGRAFSHNGPEDAGDRVHPDAAFSTNFAVLKDGAFRSLGMNVLARPLYDLGPGQFAELIPRPAPGAYSAPEYQGRSVLLAGHHYFVLYDQVQSSSVRHRLSWFVRHGEQLPFMTHLRGEAPRRTPQRTDHTHGVWLEGAGDSLVLVTHRPGIQAESTPFGARVRFDDTLDLVFRHPEPVRYSSGETHFEGTAGLIRTTGQRVEFALFHGTRLAVPGLAIETEDTDLGFGGALVPGQAPRGVFYTLKPSSVRLTAPAWPEAHFYVDGVPVPARRQAGALVIHLEPGRHHWEFTRGLPVPVAPAILRTENHPGGARVFVSAVPSATSYRLELSEDAGQTWSPLRTALTPSFDITDLPERKFHLRAVALNAGHESEPGPDYPLYVTRRPPLPPDGLRVELSNGAATLTWGEVLGVREYRLYVRRKGSLPFRLLYRGLDRVFTDRRPAIQPCHPIPGPAAKPPAADIFEYVVTAWNPNGESPRSRPADTDPASWRNWSPAPPEPFRRLYSSQPIYPPNPHPWPRHYPD